MRIWGKPVEFRGIKIYPVKMKDCTDFYENVSCFMYEKNKIQDVQILKMDYLTFLFALMKRDEEIFKRLDYILKLTLQDQKYEFQYTDEGLIFLSVNNIVLSGHEFESVKKYIQLENMIPIDDEVILDIELEKTLREAEEFNARKSGVSATLEERIVALHCLSGISYGEIENYTIFQFNKTLQRFSVIKNYDTYSALLAEHGASSDVQHWMAHLEEKDRYSDVIMTQDEFEKITADEMFNK